MLHRVLRRLAPTDEMDRFVEHMESFGIREMARTGVTALERGDRTIHDEE